MSEESKGLKFTCAGRTLYDFAMDNSFIRGIRGPLGSGKSAQCAIEILRRAGEQAKNRDGVRPTRWAIIRNCYDEKTEILTEHGWKFFKDLGAGEQVAQLNNGFLEFVTPLSYYRAPFHGEMVGFQGEGVDFLVTPNHKMYVSKKHGRSQVYRDYQFRLAKDIYGSTGYRVKRDAKWNGIESKFSADVFEWLGFFFAEGHVGIKDGRKRLRITQVKPEGVAYCRELFSRADIPFKEVKNHSRVDFCVCFGRSAKTRTFGDVLFELLKDCGLATTKKVPHWIKNSTTENIAAFINGFINGDGNRGAVTVAFTSSKALADDLQEMALRAGMVANITTRDRRGKVSYYNGKAITIKAVEWIVTFLTPSKYKPRLAKHAGRYKGWHKEQYDGEVYCLEVPTHLVYVRRNGRAFWCSQSYPELLMTTLKTWAQWCPTHYGRFTKGSPVTHHIRSAELDIEVFFLALDREEDQKKLLSLELTGAWINEAREINKAILDMLTGRVGRYPAKVDVEPTWFGIIMDTNPPDNQSWYYNWETNPPANSRFFVQPPGDSELAENVQNLPKNYYQNLVAGKTDDWIKVYVQNQFGYVVQGQAVFQNFRDSVHTEPKLAPIPKYPIFIGCDFGLCYSDDTEVLTDNGWKLFKDCNTVDKFATLNPQTRELEYHNASFSTEYDYEGKMLQWDSTSLNLLITPEHIVPYSKRESPQTIRWASAKELSENMTTHNYAQLTAGYWTGEPVTNPMGWDPITFAQFMGIYLSEGCVDKKTNRIAISQIKPAPDFQSVLDKTGIKWNKSDRGWRCSNAVLADYLRAFGLQKERYIPKEIRMAGRHVISEFIHFYTRGDGHIRFRPGYGEEHSIHTCSSRLAGDLQDLALKMGWTSSCCIVPPSRSFYAKEQRVIRSSGGFDIRFKKNLHRAEFLKENFSVVKYKGKIYCVSVPHHTLYVRRNGRPSWNGNTPAAVLAQRTPDGRWLVFDEFVASDCGHVRFAESLKQYVSSHYPLNEVQHAFGDPAGSTRSSSDERTAFQVMQTYTGWRWSPAPSNDFGIRREVVINALNRLVDGKPGLSISPRCGVLRKGLTGSYHFKYIHAGGGNQIHETPAKNEYSHVCEALQYLLLGAGEVSVLLGKKRSSERRSASRRAEGLFKSNFDDLEDR